MSRSPSSKSPREARPCGGVMIGEVDSELTQSAALAALDDVRFAAALRT